MKTIWSKAIVALACGALFAGCAANAISNARASLDRAKAAGAETTAPGDYYLAEEYLKAASTEADEGNRGKARNYAEKSEKYSTQAVQKAGGGAK